MTDDSRVGARPSGKVAIVTGAAGGIGEATVRRSVAEVAHVIATDRDPSLEEMFIALGFGELVARARDGARRSELAKDVPRELLEQVCAIGTAQDIRARLAEYHAAGADHIGVVPATAEDPAGARVLTALSPSAQTQERAA